MITQTHSVQGQRISNETWELLTRTMTSNRVGTKGRYARFPVFLNRTSDPRCTVHVVRLVIRETNRVQSWWRASASHDDTAVFTLISARRVREQTAIAKRHPNATNWKQRFAYLLCTLTVLHAHAAVLGLDCQWRRGSGGRWMKWPLLTNSAEWCFRLVRHVSKPSRSEQEQPRLIRSCAKYRYSSRKNEREREREREREIKVKEELGGNIELCSSQAFVGIPFLNSPARHGWACRNCTLTKTANVCGRSASDLHRSPSYLNSPFLVLWVVREDLACLSVSPTVTTQPARNGEFFKGKYCRDFECSMVPDPSHSRCHSHKFRTKKRSYPFPHIYLLSENSLLPQFSRRISFSQRITIIPGA